MKQYSIPYVLGFITAVCLACSLAVSGLAVSLKDVQDRNALEDKQVNVLLAAGILKAGEAKPSGKELADLFAGVQAKVLDLSTGELADPEDEGVPGPKQIDLDKDAKDPETSIELEGEMARLAQVSRVPRYVPVYLVMEKGEIKKFVLPIWGKGLWSTLWGFIALEADGQTIAGLTYYKHGETPGLGGEVDNQAWKDKWVGKRAFSPDFTAVEIEVVKGSAPPKSETKIDGLSGATITSNGVKYMLQLWLGPKGYGPFLAAKRSKKAASGGN